MIVATAVFAAAALVLMVASSRFGLHPEALASTWLAAARGPWGLAGAIAVFAILAFVGAPQIALIAAAVLVFGPYLGALYSWIGTLVSAVIGYGLGRLFGRGRLATQPQGAVARFMTALGENGFLASLMVRLAPLAPFVLINMAAGAARIGVADFVAGTAIGIIPKIALTALAGSASVQALRRGGPVQILLAVAAVTALFAAAVVVQRWIRRRRSDGDAAVRPPGRSHSSGSSPSA